MGSDEDTRETTRVKLVLPRELHESARLVAEQSGVSLSSVITQALSAWMRGRLIDAWLAEWRVEHGEFDEDELRAFAAAAGLPYFPPVPRSG